MFTQVFRNLNIEDRVEIVRSYFPNTTTFKIDQLARKFDHVLMLVQVISNPALKEYGQNLEEMTTNDIEHLPTTLDDFYKNVWDRLSEESRNTLLFGAMVTPCVSKSYSPGIVENRVWNFELMKLAHSNTLVARDIHQYIASDPSVVEHTV